MMTPMTAPSPDQPEGPPFAASAIPTDPDELAAWKDQYVDEITGDITAGEWGGIGWDWRRSG